MLTSYAPMYKYKIPLCGSLGKVVVAPARTMHLHAVAFSALQLL